MISEKDLLRQQLRIEAQQVAATIRRIEMVSPGCFGEAAAVIRQQAAGDDVAPNDLALALASVRLTLRDAMSLMEHQRRFGGDAVTGPRHSSSEGRDGLRNNGP